MQSKVTLEFDDERVICDQIYIPSKDVMKEDFIFCAFEGVVHVHRVEVRGALVDIYDCEGRAHIYNSKDGLDVARPSVI